MASLWLNSDGKLVVDATSGKAILCSTCPCCIPNDDFSGTGTNSGSVGDANWNGRWTTINNDGTASIVSSQLNLSLPSSSGVDNERYENCFTKDASTNFDVQASVDWGGIDVTLTSGQFSLFFLYVYFGSVWKAAVVGKWGPGHTYLPNQTGYDFQTSAGGSANGAAASTGTSDTLRVARSSGTVTGYFNANSYSFGTENAAVTSFQVRLIAIGAFANSIKINSVTAT